MHVYIYIIRPPCGRTAHSTHECMSRRAAFLTPADALTRAEVADLGSPGEQRLLAEHAARLQVVAQRRRHLLARVRPALGDELLHLCRIELLVFHCVLHVCGTAVHDPPDESIRPRAPRVVEGEQRAVFVEDDALDRLAL